MGMFDTVHIVCPNCHKHTEEQTKAGPCILKNYFDLNDPAIAMSMPGKYYCENCAQPYLIEVVTQPQIIARALTEDELEAHRRGD